MGLDVLNTVSIKKLKGIGGFTFVDDSEIDNINFWRSNLLTDSQSGFSWTKKTNPPRLHSHFGMDIIGDNIYFMGGAGFGEGEMYLTKYNITSDSYTTIADVDIGFGIPSGRSYIASGIYNGYFYMFGGQKNSGVTNESWRVNLTSGSDLGKWERLANTPLALANSGCFGSNGLFYIHCGSNRGYPTVTTYNQLWSYNTISNIWTTSLPSYGPTMNQNEMVSIGNHIYSIGGSIEHTTIFYNNNERYDIASNTWYNSAPMSVARNDHSITVMDGKIYIFGGNNTSQLYDVVRYDPVTNTWADITTTPDTTPVWYVQVGRAITYGYDIYINSMGQMWKFSSNEVEKFAVMRIY